MNTFPSLFMPCFVTCFTQKEPGAYYKSQTDGAQIIPDFNQNLE